jgi:hypothetical protein
MTPASALLITCGILLVVLFIWSWREFHFSAERQSYRREGKYLLREIDEQRKMRKDRATALAEAMVAKEKFIEQDLVGRQQEWKKLWLEIFEVNSFGIIPQGTDEKGNFIWEEACSYAADMKQHRGFTHGQVKIIRRFARAIKKALKEEQRLLEALCPMGEIEFDSEGGLRVK